MTRRLVLLGTIAAAVLAIPGVAVAHGIGGRGDLPVPVEYFLVGAGLALALSFAALAVLWPEPRLQGIVEPRVISERWGAVLARVLAVVGVVGLVVVLVTGLFGEDDRNNAAGVLVWVYFWLVIPFLSALFGDLWRWLNPWKTLAEQTGLGEEEKPGFLERWGLWPATAAFIAFTWLELVWSDPSRPRTVALAALVYTVYLVNLIMALGRETAVRSGDAFSAYNGLIGAMAPVAIEDGALVRRGWLRSLVHVPERPGLVAFVVAMIGTVSWDGLSQTDWWGELAGSAYDSQWLGTLGLLLTVLVIGAGYLLASAAAARLAEDPEMTAMAVARSFAHTLVPIALAYAFAHYFTLVIYEGQLLFAAISDPLGRGWDLFGTADHRIDFFLSATTVWYIQVAAIVAGHVAAIVLAHDRALAVFHKKVAVRTQYAMLGLMVALTVFGLVLLSAG